MVEGGVRTSAFIAFMLAPVSSIAMPIVPTVTVSELQEAFEWLGAGRVAFVFSSTLWRYLPHERQHTPRERCTDISLEKTHR